MGYNLLGIETSCDETAAAVVEDGLRIRSSVVASQVEMHRAWSGVLPEAASRAHLQVAVDVVDQALAKAGIELADVDAIGVTTHPGLVGSLLVGVSTAKALAWAMDKPLIGINHLEAHVEANRLHEPSLEPPFLSLVISGGHTEFYRYGGLGQCELIGCTRDDAAGEAFDKVAAMLGLAYPGGPSISAAATRGNPKAVTFPRALLGRDSLEFSFSGLKTAVLYHLRGYNAKRGGFGAAAELDDQQVADVAASFQRAVVDTVVEKVRRAVVATGLRQVAIGGGVACNTCLREALAASAAKHGYQVHIPPPSLCTDNAAMVAALAHRYWRSGTARSLNLDVRSRA